MTPPPPITSPYAPDLGQVRAWLETMIKALRFLELVAAVLALIGKMRDANTELVKQLAHLRRARPRSETLERLERQLVLPLGAIAAVSVAPQSLPATSASRRVVGVTRAAGTSPRICRACRCSTRCRRTRVSARSAAPR
jgi:hypothetical protein